MKRLIIASIVALVAVMALGLYSLSVLSDFERKDRELREAFEARARELRETDALFPYEPAPHLDPVRFPIWLEVRGEVAAALVARAGEAAGNAFHARETRARMLALLREELVERDMSLAEYRATAARWRALLAVAEFERLRESWRVRTATSSRPQGLPLPPPAADAQEKELDLIGRYERLLEASMDADLLDPVLDGISAEGVGPGEER